MRSSILMLLAVSVTACHSAPQKTAPTPLPALPESASAALRWVNAHDTGFQSTDSIASPAEREQLLSLALNARVIGFSELTEGTHQFAYIVRRALLALGESARVRGLAIQAPMADAMELDRYVRTGVGDPRELVRALGSWRWETREVRALIEAIRAYNRGRATAEQIGFYGFEIPSAAHAVGVIAALPDSVTGAPLKAWLKSQYACVAINEGAQWGREGRLSDSSYWNACGPATSRALDSLAALRRRVAGPRAGEVAFAEEMAKVIAHHVRVGLRHLKREEVNAEHVMFLADLIGVENQLVLWGGDVEMGRLTLDSTTVQTAVPLSARLGDRYRAIAFAFGDGAVRARPLSVMQGAGGAPNLSDVTVGPPLPGTYEHVFIRAQAENMWIDMRQLPSDTSGTWLRGPRQMRLITEAYSALTPEAFETTVELPKNFDAVVFVRRVTPAKQ